MSKKTIKRLLAGILAAVLVLGLAATAVAVTSEPAVIYNGSTKKIEFRDAIPFNDNEAPDLFPDMKNLMPGDEVTQKITVGADNIGIDRVRITLRAENENEDFNTLVKKYPEWVTFTVKNGDEVLTEGNLKDGVALGTFAEDGKTTVSVTLSINIEAGNELQGLVAMVDWVFTAEVIPTYLPAPDVTVKSDLPWLNSVDHVNYIIGDDKGMVRPNDPITRAEVATIFYRLMTNETREAFFSTESIYPDVTGDDWFCVAVCTLTQAGVLEGYPDGNFGPNDYLSRAELATIISRFDTKFGELKITETFEDVEGHWAEEYIEFAATRSYVVGYPDGTFRPEQAITRAETVTMINRCLQRVVDEKGLTKDYIDWPDNLPGTWCYYEMVEAGNNHDYARSNRKVEYQTYLCENWTVLLEPIDWAGMEAEFIRILNGQE